METVHLMGAEDVRVAGSTISRAAETISMAAGSINSTVDLGLRRLDEMVSRFESAAQDFAHVADCIDDLRNEVIERLETKVPTPGEVEAAKAPNPAALEDLSEIVAHATRVSASSGVGLEEVLREILKAMREPIG